MHCAVGRHPEEVDLAAVQAVLDAVDLVDLTRGDMLAAGTHAPLRTGDAIHLAVALRIGAEEIATYDLELADRAWCGGARCARACSARSLIPLAECPRPYASRCVLYCGRVRATRRPGRPRSEASRRAILDAAAQLTQELGYAGLTVEGIASRAGVGKQTVYRWWSTRADVLLEAALSGPDFELRVSDHGSFAEDLRALLSSCREILGDSDRAEIVRGLVAEAQVDHAFGERLRSAFAERGSTALREIAARAYGRGRLPSHVDPDLIADIVFGTLWFRVLLVERPFDEQLVDQLVALLTGSCEPAPRPLTVHPRAGIRRLPLPWRGSGEQRR